MLFMREPQLIGGENEEFLVLRRNYYWIFPGEIMCSLRADRVRARAERHHRRNSAVELPEVQNLV